MASDSSIVDAVKQGDAERVERLVAEQPGRVLERDEDGVSAVLLAQYYGRTDLVDLMLATEPELDLFEASALGKLDRVLRLLEQDPASVSSRSGDGFTPLHLAAFFGHADIGKLLLAKGGDVGAVSENALRVMPLHSAVAGRHLDVARHLVEHGADVNARQERGFTPLHGAAQHGDANLVELLLANGADPGARMDDGKTPGDLALEHGHADVAARL